MDEMMDTWEKLAQLMEENELVALLFTPGFSTAKVVSDVSGRGVGLDVVKNKIEGLGGDVEVVRLGVEIGGVPCGKGTG